MDRQLPASSADESQKTKASSRVAVTLRPPVKVCAAPARRHGFALYLDAAVAGLRLGLDADVGSTPAGVVARVAALVGDDGGDALGRISLDEEPVQRGGGALRDGGGLVGGVGFVRVPAVDHPALRDVDAGSAAHTSAPSPRLGTTFQP